MNKHNKSLGNSSTNKSALSTDMISKSKQQSILSGITGQLGRHPDVVNMRFDELARKKEMINTLKCIIEDPFRKPNKAAKSFLRDAIADYKSLQERMIGMPSYTDNTTLQYEGPNDIPTVPLSGLVPVQRTAYIVKTAGQGTAAGGFYATLFSSDLAPWVSSTNPIYRVKSITSWTVNRTDGSLTQGTFAGVSIPVSSGAAGTEVTPIWSENYEPIGHGFASIVTKFPLGGYPLYSTGGVTENICLHFTSLGGVGGIAGIPVVFHVTVETLI